MVQTREQRARAADIERRDRANEELWAREAAEPRQHWPPGHTLNGEHWRWITDGTLEGRWEIDEACTEITLPSHGMPGGNLVERLGARHPADRREELGLVDTYNRSTGSKYDELGNDAVVALLRTLVSSSACNHICTLSLAMMGLTTSGFVEIAEQCRRAPLGSFQVPVPHIHRPRLQ